jgi:hypothetical protein
VKVDTPPEKEQIFDSSPQAVVAMSSASTSEKGPCLLTPDRRRRTIGGKAAHPRARMNTQDEKPKEAHRARSPLHTSYPRTPPSAAPTTQQDAAGGRSRQKRRHGKRCVNKTIGKAAAGHSSTSHNRTRRHQEPLSSLLTSPPSQGDASKEVMTPKCRRHPIRGIWGFHPGKRGRKELGLNLDIACKEGAPEASSLP